MRVHGLAVRHVETAALAMRMVVRALGEHDVVVVRVAVAPEGKPGDEVVRPGNVLDALQHAASVDEGERLSRSVRPLRDEDDVLGAPDGAAFDLQLEARRRVVFVDFDGQDAVAGVDPYPLGGRAARVSLKKAFAKGAARVPTPRNRWALQRTASAGIFGSDLVLTTKRPSQTQRHHCKCGDARRPDADHPRKL